MSLRSANFSHVLILDTGGGGEEYRVSGSFLVSGMLVKSCPAEHPVPVVLTSYCGQG